MKSKNLFFFAFILCGPLLFFGQKKPVNMKVKSPERFYSESGIPLRVEEKRDAKGQLTEKTFYRDRSKPKSDTINEKQFYTNGKLSEVLYYTGEGKISFGTKYDSNGKESETTFYEPNGDIHSKSVYTNGADGTSKTARYGKGGVLESVETSDDENRLLQEIRYSNGEMLSKEICQYDGKMAACKKKECMSYNKSNALTRKIVYDHQTKRKEETTYFKSGKIETYNVYEDAYTKHSHPGEMWIYKEDGSYNKQLMQTFKTQRGGSKSVSSEIISFDPGGKITGKLAFTYDAGGNETEMTGHNADGKMYFKSVHKNDDKGNKQESTGYDAAGKIIYTDVYKYDDKGWLTEIERTKPDGAKQLIMKNGQYIK